MKKNILVVGASGKAGHIVVQTCLELFGSDCFIVGTHFKEGSLMPSVHVSLQVDVTTPSWIDQVVLWNELLQTEPYDFVFFCFAQGPVGFPTSEATEQQITDASARSYDPLIELEQWFVGRAIVAFGSFVDLPIARLAYGAMVPVKHRLRQWVRESSPVGITRYLLRLGAFMSESTNSIQRLLGVQLWRRRRSAEDVLVREFSNCSGGDLNLALEKRTLLEERIAFGTTRPTADADIATGVRYVLDKILSHPRELSVVGDALWVG